MCRRDNIDLRHEGLSVKFARVSRAVPETGLFREWHPFAANPKTPIRMNVHASFFGAALTAPCSAPRVPRFEHVRPPTVSADDTVVGFSEQTPTEPPLGKPESVFRDSIPVEDSMGLRFR